MKPRAEKQWNDGVIPELSDIDKAYAKHFSTCTICVLVPLNPCEEGRKLYEAVKAQYGDASMCHEERP